MSGDGVKQRFVSTFRMQVKPPRASAAASSSSSSSPGNGTVDTRASDPGRASCGLPRAKPPLDPPVFLEPLQDGCVDEGSDITLRGVLTGSQPITVSWLHNGEMARFGKPVFDGREASYLVRECLPEDAGTYTCTAVNRTGRTSCCAAVRVRDLETIYGVPQSPVPISTSLVNGSSPAPPINELQELKGSDTQRSLSCHRGAIPKKRADSGKGSSLHFQEPPQHLKVEVGQTARLSCLFSGSPPVAACWIRNKEQVVDSPELWTENTNGSSTLLIAEAAPHHAGYYTVIARDRKGSAQHTITLSVIERPQPPASSPVVSRISASDLVLSWSGPCYDGGSAVLGYVVEVKKQEGAQEEEEEEEKWSELTAQCRSTSYRVSTGLQPEGSYRFRVRAFNAAGAGEPGPVSPVVRMEEKDPDKRREEEAPLAYSCIAVDSSHKVTDHYTLQEKLGMGKFGLVFKLVHKETGRVCAGKFYKGRRAKEREAARKEIELMNHLHHHKLVQCLAAYDHKPEMVMVMEYIAGGELFERIVDDNFEHTEPASVNYMQQILEGISFMHEQGIIHLDLKPENIVCVDSSGTSVKIIDFGLASKLDANTPLKVMHGTPEFVAPEVINYEPVCLATDMWSIGVICYILLSGESPFQGSSDAETLALVTAAQWEFDDESFDEITDEAKSFISSLLNINPRRRMSCKDALAHPWMAAFESGDGAANTKSLSKEKMKKFLARQKWKKAGKAMLALKRMALLSKSDGSASPTSPGGDSPLSPEAEHALQTLEQKMQGPPCFTQRLEDQTVAVGSSASLSCHLSGYPDPEVVWLRGEEPIVETPMVQIEYEEDGRCALVLAKVGLADANVYTCKATNEHGETSCSAKLSVLK